MTYHRYGYKIRKSNGRKLDKILSMKIDSKLLEDFKKAVGKEYYQPKVRELMQEYVDKQYRDRYDEFITRQ